MNPDQFNAPAPPPPASNPYDFITTGGKPPKSGRLPSTSNPFVAKLIVLVGGAVVVMIVVTLVVNLLFGSKTNLNDLVSLAQTEQEIARVTNQTQQTATDQTVAGAAISTRLTLLTQQQGVLTYLSTHRHKVGAKDLGLKKNITTDKRLVQAQATSTFDIVFTQIMRGQLQDYATSLQTASDSSSSKMVKTFLTTDYNQVQMLLKQWPSS